MDRVVGFSIGADDYVIKPFSPRELVERVKAILRRSRGRETREKPILRFANLVLEPEKHKVTRDGKVINLTPSEYKLLYCLMSSPGRVYSRSELLERLYDNGGVVIDRVVDVHIGKLRQKIDGKSKKPPLLRTVHGVGYAMNEDALNEDAVTGQG
jgi:DNA-binding response OmpR family regulator